MDRIIVRKGRVEDAEDFSKLVLLSAPVYYSSLYGPYAESIMKNLFIHPKNFFSFEHSCFIEIDGKRAGMALGYDGKQGKEEGWRTGILLVRYLKWRFFIRIFSFLFSFLKTRTAGKIAEDEYYLSTIAVYPEFRSHGLGLLLAMEREARKKGAKKIILNVDQNNTRVIKLYNGLEYSFEKRTFNFKINKTLFRFLRVYKIL